MKFGNHLERVTATAGQPFWLVSGYDKIRELLGDPRLSRSHPDEDHAVRLTQPGFFGGAMPGPQDDLRDHQRMRRLLAPAFTTRRMEALRPRVEAVVDERLDELEHAGSPADFHRLVAFPLPALVICELFGVPPGERADFMRWQVDATQVQRPALARASLQSLWRYLGALIERKRATPGEDVISQLVESRRKDPTLTDDGIAHLLAGMLFAGHQPVVAIIERGVLLLLEHPEQRRALQDNPALATTAVEEAFRYPSPTENPATRPRGGLTRYAAEDIDVDGVTIFAGDTVMFAVQDANHDVEHFPDPARFDISREQNPHLSLSHGVHFCLGAPLARIEIACLFRRLFTRFPTLRLDTHINFLRQIRDVVPGAVEELPVAW
jgi:cytochrome P450